MLDVRCSMFPAPRTRAQSLRIIKVPIVKSLGGQYLTSMSMKVLIVPDKFKGTLAAPAAAEAIERGWRKARPSDSLELLPMSDGGDGFGQVLSGIFGAKQTSLKTVDAAHRPIRADWWWEAKSRTAIIESANVIGLTLLPRKKFHPFKLDTFGLGAVIRAAAAKGAKRCYIGIG